MASDAATLARPGKRKRSGPITVSKSVKPPTRLPADDEDEDESEDSDDLREAFRKAFEKKFAPLPGGNRPTFTKSKKSKKTKIEEIEDLRSESEEDDEEEDDFNGFDDASFFSSSSPDTETEEIEVIDTTARPQYTEPDGLLPAARLSGRSFMSSKPPLSAAATQPTTPQEKRARAAEAAADRADLADDLALQRLLSESHLLSAPSPSSTLSHQSGASASARRPRSVRAAQLDLRVRALGGRESAQAKMPLAHRRGIAAKAVEREARRRKDAREAGVVLERPGAGRGGGRGQSKRGGSARRERAVDAPGLGRFRGGTLSLSERDVRKMSDRGGRGRGKRGGRGR